MKWYIACAGDSELTGGSTPKASQVRKIMSVGWPATHGILALRMNSMGYAASGVFSDADIGEVHQTILVEHNVFEHRPKAERLENIGFALGGKIDSFRVAAALYVEDAFITPAMLIIAYEEALGVSGERGFAGTA
jgi:hypothetical protein